MERKTLIRKFWSRKEFLSIKNKQYNSFLISFINKKIKEDIKKGDLTTNAIIKNEKITAYIIAKQPGIIAGIEEISFFLKKNSINCKPLKKDGQKVKNKDIIIKIYGNARKILNYERTILNILQRMSGIATYSYNLSQKVNCQIAGTRKTLFDLLDKKAISVGNCLTHRLNLNDFVMIKDNHLKILNNNIEKALKLANKSKTKFIEIEVKNKKEALKAANFISSLKTNKLFAIMFDNMNPREIKEPIIKIKKINKKILFEVSGNMNEANIKKFSKTGTDIISLGSLTHSVKAFDLSLRIG